MKNDIQPTTEEINRGTRPCVLKADGSSWVSWRRKGCVYCKWTGGACPEATPRRMSPEEFERDYEE